MSRRPDLFRRLTALADPIRCRVLLALERHELTVSELHAALQLPQSTTSRHLKVLGDDGWVVSRVDGASNRYRMTPALEPAPRRLWQIVREQLSESPAAAHDAERVRAVLARRHTRSQEFFSTAAGQWDRLRTELFGQRTELMALLGLLDDSWTVGDLGCGTGLLAASLAPFVQRVIAVDESAAMLRGARARLRGTSNVELRSGTLEALPIADGELDAAMLVLVLHYLSDPAAALAETRRVLRPGGRLLLVDMMPHERAEYRVEMGHVWQGFGRDQIDGWLSAAGFGAWHYRSLPSDPSAKGPGLFAVSARRAENEALARVG
jgi:ubiquinone/menaquinone biosynthesis C-methylase UbiE